MKLKREEWLLVFIPLIAAWGFDRITKLWALGLRETISFGFINLKLYFNHGAMLGLFADLPALLRIVSLATTGAFLIFAFGVIQYMLPIKSLRLRSGLSILLGGILGNVSDRILYGYVVDFIQFQFNQWPSPIFNVADALQWVGYGFIGLALMRDGELLWPTTNARNRIWINALFQLRYCLLLVGIGLAFSIIAGFFSYTFLRVTIIDLIGNNEKLLQHYLRPYVYTYTLVTALFCGALFLVGRHLSARIAGPLYSFEKWLDDIAAGKAKTLKLRAGDEFKHLEQTAERLSQRLVQQSTADEETVKLAVKKS